MHFYFNGIQPTTLWAGITPSTQFNQAHTINMVNAFNQLHCGRASPHHHNLTKHIPSTWSMTFKHLHCGRASPRHHNLTNHTPSAWSMAFNQLYCGRVSPRHKKHNTTKHTPSTWSMAFNQLHCGRASSRHHNTTKHTQSTWSMDIQPTTLWAGIIPSPQFNQALHAINIVVGNHPVATIQPRIFSNYVVGGYQPVTKTQCNQAYTINMVNGIQPTILWAGERHIEVQYVSQGKL